jgi:hypothetical protein
MLVFVHFLSLTVRCISLILLTTGTPQQIVIPISGSYMYPSTITDSFMAKPAVYINAADKQYEI